MTSPRLSTDGTISAIERALATWEAEVATTTKALGYADAYNRRCKAELAAARAELAELLHDCMALSAGACIVDGGLVGDDGGSPFCTMRERAEKAEAELAELRAQPEQAMEPLGAEFSAVWDANVDKLHESEPGAQPEQGRPAGDGWKFGWHQEQRHDARVMEGGEGG